MGGALMSEPATKTMNMIEAINSALDVMLAKDPDVVIMGEDVGYFGGVFRATAGLQKKHGKTRVFDTPISESALASAWRLMAFAPCPRFSLPTISTPALTSWSVRPHACAIVLPMILSVP
jgi:hypothetical protein